jgi:hypothetical protein
VSFFTKKDMPVRQKHNPPEVIDHKICKTALLPKKKGERYEYLSSTTVSIDTYTILFTGGIHQCIELSTAVTHAKVTFFHKIW